MLNSGAGWLDEEESRHCRRVMRKKPGEIIHISDGCGTIAEARLVDVDERRCTYTIENNYVFPQDPYSVEIALAPTKNADRIEWFVEKSVELGVHKVSFIICRHSVREIVQINRLRRVAISAMKQSGRAWLPVLNPPVQFDVFVGKSSADSKFIAHLGDSQPEHLMILAKPCSNYTVLIGPEGDFSREEIQIAEHAGFSRVSLGSTRLRTETAALAACHSLILCNINKNETH